MHYPEALLNAGFVCVCIEMCFTRLLMQPAVGSVKKRLYGRS